MMMGTDVLLEQNPLQWLTKWSEESVGLMNRRQHRLQETTESLMRVVQDALELKPAADPLRRLYGNLFELCNSPMETLVERAQRGAAALDISVSIQLVIDWVHSLPPELRVQIGRVDQAYAGLLASAPGGSGASASASVSVGT